MDLEALASNTDGVNFLSQYREELKLQIQLCNDELHQLQSELKVLHARMRERSRNVPYTSQTAKDYDADEAESRRLAECIERKQEFLMGANPS